MNLLVFAHRGEAQVFFKELQAKNVEGLFDGLFKYEDGLILLTGEGHWRALEKTAAVLGRFAEIKSVWNFGVTGALREGLEIGQVCAIRTIYSQSERAEKAPSIKMNFHSFQSAFNQAEVDLVTSAERVLTKGLADYLDSFAPLVDREAWGVARAAKLFSLPFYPIKIVSDLPFKGEKEEICQYVKEEAEIWSDRLYRSFLDFQENEQHSRGISFDEKNQWKWDGLYFTVALERKLNYLMDSLTRKGLSISEIEKRTCLKDIIESKKRPKERAKKLLNELQYLLNPIALRTQRNLEEHLVVLKKAGFEVSFDPHFEYEKLEIKAVIEKDEKVQLLREGLESFSYSNIVKVLRGKK